ncbi:MAG: hypothetical protein J6T16_03315 [Opitutales bacterium]|nr:hypothetical protein [Opitutales bacterium]
MGIVIPNLTRSQADRLDRLYRYAVDKHEMKRFNYMLRQRQIAAAAEKIDAVRFSPLGEFIGAIDTHTFLRWQQTDPDCWKDESFVKKFLKDNPECRGVKVQRRVFNGFGAGKK